MKSKFMYKIADFLYHTSKKLFKKADELEHFKWLEYKSKHNKLICGINNSECIWCACWNHEKFKHHGCMYLKGYIDY